MNDRLRVLIDAAPLGYGVEPGIGRAGIFRATEGFLLEALRRPELDVHVAALEHYLAEVQLLRYDLASASVLAARRVSGWRHPTLAHDTAAALVDQIRALGEANPAARRLKAELALTNRLARAVPLPGVYDVHHSVRTMLSDRPHVSARARVLTVYDVIPLQRPEWFEDGIADRMRLTVASLNRDRDWIICNSSQVRDDVISLLSMRPDRVVVVPLAADPAVFHPVHDRGAIDDVRRRYHLGERPYLLSLCTLEPRKNLGRLLAALPRLLAQPPHRDLQLVLAGAPGWKTEGFMDALETSATRDRVRVTGFVPDRDLAALYAGAEVFVYPSLYEGFGLPVLEAMQCGVPVVTTSGGALPEVAGLAAIIIDPQDEDALVEAVVRARGNGRLVASGLARAATFTWRRTVDLTIAAYRAMLAAS